MSQQFALVGNGPITNRGCEAIVLGTKSILEQAFGESKFLLASFANDSADDLPDNIYPVSLPFARPRWSKAWFKYRVRNFLCLPEDLSGVLNPLKGELDNIKAVLSIGGDGYAIDFGHYVVDRLIVINEYAQQLGIPTIIWGASIGPFNEQPEFEKRIAEHFRTLDLIVVREPHTKQYLSKLGVTENIHFAPDPAFALASQVCDLPSDIEDILQIGAVGLNLSPLIAKYTSQGDIDRWSNLATKLVEQVLIVSQRPVLLVYHVTAPGRANRVQMDDRVFLQGILDNLPPQYRTQVALLPDNLSASQLKGVIGRTSIFIGARTHSTISALSSQVPCISIAYSTKAWGINELVYGHNDWVIPSPRTTTELLGQKVENMLSQYDEVKSQLTQSIPSLIDAAFQSGEAMRHILG